MGLSLWSLVCSDLQAFPFRTVISHVQHMYTHIEPPCAISHDGLVGTSSSSDLMGSATKISQSLILKGEVGT